MADRYLATYPAAMKFLLADHEGLTAYQLFPTEHHHRIRHSNFIEPAFGETRRRAKVIGRLPGQTRCPALVWAVPGPRSRGLTMTSDGLRRTPPSGKQLETCLVCGLSSHPEA